MDLSYRPYFHDALERGTGRFYGIGTTSGKPGFYYSQADPRSWRGDRRCCGQGQPRQCRAGMAGAVTSRSSSMRAVSCSSPPIRTGNSRRSDRCSPPPRRQSRASRQYAGVRLAPLGPRRGSGCERRRAHGRGGRRRLAPALSGARHPTPEPTWRVDPAVGLLAGNVLVRNTVAFTAVALAFVLLLFLYLHQRRRAISASLAAKEALQRAHDELERKVAERTADLVASQPAAGARDRRAAARRAGACARRRTGWSRPARWRCSARCRPASRTS